MNLVKCERWHLEARCTERGYTIAEVMPCVVSEDGDDLIVDVDHAAYPIRSRLPQPGTVLKEMLQNWPLRINVTKNCACNSRAALMDSMERAEPGWCFSNMDKIIGWLREQAKERGMLFSDTAARLFVRIAINKAYKRTAK